MATPPPKSDLEAEARMDACPFCGENTVHHQRLASGIESWACLCGWFRIVTMDGEILEQSRVVWEAWPG